MINFDSFEQINLAEGITNLRKGIDQLASIVQNSFEISSFQNSLYIFCNRSRDKLKILYWDKTGFWKDCPFIRKKAYRELCYLVV